MCLLVLGIPSTANAMIQPFIVGVLFAKMCSVGFFVIINKLQDCFQMREGVFLPNFGQLVVFRLLKMMINRAEYMYKYIIIVFCLFT